VQPEKDFPAVVDRGRIGVFWGEPISPVRYLNNTSTWIIGWGRRTGEEKGEGDNSERGSTDNQQ
jgi:hypothetical protein